MSNPNAVPHFLIIGAMKAGTTTLYRDLVGHPEVFLPQEKEPETLVKFGDSRELVEKDYESLFSPARAGQVLGEGSTAYTKRPDFEGAAEMAMRVCGPSLKLIYLMRNPVDRIVSQYKHEFGLGQVREPINEAVVQHSRFVNYSRYEWQLEPWLGLFGQSNLLVLSFEDYVANRLAVVHRVCRFLGVDPEKAPCIDTGVAFNASEGKLAPRGVWRTLIASRFYQRAAKPLVPWGLRSWIAGRVLPKAPNATAALHPETRRDLESRLSRKEICG